MFGRRTLSFAEVIGPWLKNKGDVLNLWSVADRAEGTWNLAVSSTLGVEQLPKEPPLYRIKWRPRWADLRKSVQMRSPRIAASHLVDGVSATLIPDRILAARRLVSGGKISVLLDCSGYAYGDVWSTDRVRHRAEYYARLKGQGAYLVLLPQALGPFQDRGMRSAAAELLNHFDLVYARDRISLDHVRGLQLTQPQIDVAPDITHLLEGATLGNGTAWDTRVCIVPNARMIDRNSSASAGDRYIELMRTSIQKVRELDLEPVLLIHERNDAPLVREIRSGLSFAVSIVDEDALLTKGILGNCYAVIGSRYHALVSALSQGTPVMGTSWSHKYEELFGDYDCADYLLSPANTTSENESRIEDFLMPEKRNALARKISQKAKQQKERVRSMWSSIEAQICSA